MREEEEEMNNSQRNWKSKTISRTGERWGRFRGREKVERAEIRAARDESKRNIPWNISE